MNLREKLNPSLEIIRTFDPVSDDVLDDLPRALEAHLRSTAGAASRRICRGGDGRWGRLPASDVPAAIAGAVTRVPAGLGREELMRVAYHRGFRVLPITFTVSGSMVAVMQPHALYDGGTSWSLVLDVFRRAAGEDPSSEVPEPLRWPVVKALHATGLHRPDAFRAVREQRRTILRETEPARQTRLPRSRAAALATARNTVLSFDRDAVARLSASTDPAPLPSSNVIKGRPTMPVRIAGLLLESLSDVAVDDSDFRVRFAVDLRRYVHKLGEVDGCFAPAEPLGTLRTSDWSPMALTTRLAATVKSGVALVSFAADVVAVMKRVVRPVRRSDLARQGAAEICFSLVTYELALPSGFWAAEKNRVVAGGMVERYAPTSPFIQIAAFGPGYQVTIWDETGLFDHERLQDAFERRLALRETAGSLTGRP